ncbi:uncharacterized protein LOC124542385 [Vanessa cardui]|uniref:uncharacterized protein LOC124542385 n=1 Tax=Vanessa cardui TaxID=171605 RepID=UPI001F1473FF|nr:uncharacterized protein LOC124542385 [Vanessa cardui]
MESIKSSIADLTEHFNLRMAEFQRDLRNAVPASSPVSNINSQFNSFRSFVIAALESLQLQVELLSQQCDVMEMRSRRKILLVHGVPEDKHENIPAHISKVLGDHLKLPGLTADSISRSHRLGQLGKGKPRAILVKFKDTSVKDKVWGAKKNLKGTGITLSEFLTKRRHEVFLAARQRFGISRCWTDNGVVVVMGSDQSKHRVHTKQELDAIPSDSDSVVQGPSAATIVSNAVKDSKITYLRSKRIVKK